MNNFTKDLIMATPFIVTPISKYKLSEMQLIILIYALRLLTKNNFNLFSVFLKECLHPKPGN